MKFRSRIIILLGLWTAICGFDTAVAAPPLQETPADIGYPSVAAALSALRTKPGVQIQEQAGWTIITDAEAGHPVLWSFAPTGYPAYPAVVKHAIVPKDGGSDLDMRVHCEADKVSCDNLVREFEALNAQAIGSIQSGAGPRAAAGQGTAPESVNITPDSARGWLPSAEQRAQAPVAAYAFLAALDGGDYGRAYDLMTDMQQQHTKFDDFAQRTRDFNRTAGAVKERRITKVTWTKDPAHAPAPGIYAAVDLSSRFENVDRHCGYLILYQPDPSAPFKVMRQENNFMSNADASKISQQQSPAEMERLWGQVSRTCPK